MEDLTRRCNIVYYELKGVELAKSNEIRRMVFQVQWLTENIEIIATHFSKIREKLTTIKEDQ